MALGPDELLTTILTENEKQLRKLEEHVDAWLRANWEGNEAIRVPLPETARTAVINQLLLKYKHAGWITSFTRGDGQRSDDQLTLTPKNKAANKPHPSEEAHGTGATVTAEDR